jgi:hypothetical protein
MAIVVLEEGLVGLEDVQESLQQAIATLEAILTDIPGHFGVYLPAALEREVLRPLQSPAAFVTRLQQALIPLS